MRFMPGKKIEEKKNQHKNVSRDPRDAASKREGGTITTATTSTAIYARKKG